MDSLKDMLQRKADEIDASGIRDDVQLIQHEIDRYHPQLATVAKIQDGVAHITTRSSSVASDLRLQQHQILQNINKNLKSPIKRLYIRIQ